MIAKVSHELPRGVPPDVCALFEKLTLELINAGWAHYSARAILHRIRWHFHVEKGDRNFKANNNWTPAMARWFMEVYPSSRGFFRIRMLRTQGSPAHDYDRPEDHEHPFL